MIPNILFVHQHGPRAIEYFDLVYSETLIELIRNPPAHIQEQIAKIRSLAHGPELETHEQAEFRKHQRTVLKDTLPCFYTALWDDVCCTTSVDCVSTGVLALDIDVYDPAMIEQTRTAIISSALKKHVWMIFKSPSGGLKVFVATDLETTDTDVYRFGYKTLCQKFEKALKMLGCPTEIETDGQCCNINRSTFISHDPDLWLNSNPTPVKVFDAAAGAIQYERDKTADNDRLSAFKRKYESNTSNPTRKEAYLRKALINIESEMRPGNRHGPINNGCFQIYKATNGDITRCISWLTTLGANYTETMSIESKAREQYRSWETKGRPQLELN